MPSTAAIVAIRKFASIPGTRTNFGIVNDTSNSVQVPYLNPFSTVVAAPYQRTAGSWQ